jgi:hypothetical protein
MRAILCPVDGRLVLLGLIVVLTVWVARDMQPERSAAQVARDRAAAAVLVEVDRVQQCYFERRERYTDSIVSLQFARGRFMRTAYVNGLDISLRLVDGGYEQRITGDGVSLELRRRGDDVDVSGGDEPELVSCEPARGRP